MKIPRTGEISSSMAVLGLVVQQPDTIAGVAYRLSEVFPRARWSAGAAHSSMPSLAEQGLLEVVQEGSVPTLDRYQATSAGISEFRRWLIQSSSLPPALRDALQARLEFVGLEELSALLETVREDERACTREYAAAHKRWRDFTHQKLRPGEDGAEQALRRELKLVQLADEVDLWGVQARRLQKLGGRLNSVLERAISVSTEDEFEDG
jgi:DNA-binding PadR family transcriptional regulator